MMEDAEWVRCEVRGVRCDGEKYTCAHKQVHVHARTHTVKMRAGCSGGAQEALVRAKVGGVHLG